MILIIRIWLIKLLAGKTGIALNISAIDIRPQYNGQSFYAFNITDPYQKALCAIKNLQKTLDWVEQNDPKIKRRSNHD